MNIVVVNGSLSETSSSTSLAKRIVERVEQLRPAQAEVPKVEWVNLRPLGHSLVDTLYTGVAPPNVRAAYQTLAEADLVVAVTPTYQASMSGLFKLFWDLIPDGELRGKPVLLAATGGTGRHGLMIDHTLRPLFSYLGAAPLPTALFAATQDWGDAGLEHQVGMEESLEKRIERAAREIWVTSGSFPSEQAKAEEEEDDATENSSATTAFPGFVDFETLLNERGK